MFKSETLFVIGAGASKEVGMPVAGDLAQSIRKLLDMRIIDHSVRGDGAIVDALGAIASASGQSFETYRNAAIEVSEAMPLVSSIDTYIDKRTDNECIAICGKLGIVQSILQAERLSKIYIPKNQNIYAQHPNEFALSWHIPFLHALTEGVTAHDVDNVFLNTSFVIFNYDRCFEVFMHRALQRMYKLTDLHASQLMAGAKIVHPYGTVGRLPWQKGAGSAISYGDSANSSQLRELASGIKVFSERSAESAVDRNAISSLCADAQKVVFLGFSYQPQNMELLTASENRMGRAYGTAMGFSKSDQEVLRGSLHDTFKLKTSFDFVRFCDGTCTDMFREFSRSIAN